MLGVRADPEPGEAEDPIAEPGPAHGRPDRRDLSGEFEAEHPDPFAGPPRPEDQPSPPGLAAPHPALGGRHRGRVHPDQDLAPFGTGAGSSARVSTSGGPYASNMTARMRVMMRQCR
ncbi:hypothetical protein GCM10027610_047460 [Dactylosporangium cerinum]